MIYGPIVIMSREISLTGGGPWGFTLSGGKDFGAPLKVSKVSDKTILMQVHVINLEVIEHIYQ